MASFCGTQIKLDEVLAFGIPAVVVGHRNEEIPGCECWSQTRSDRRMAAEAPASAAGSGTLLSAATRAPRWNTHLGPRLRRESFSKRVVKGGFRGARRSCAIADEDGWQEERRLLARWLESLPKPVGLMACNDDCGQQVMEACKLVGLPVPDAVGVIGADNDELVCGLSDPAMSSVRVNFERPVRSGAGA